MQGLGDCGLGRGKRAAWDSAAWKAGKLAGPHERHLGRDSGLAACSLTQVARQIRAAQLGHAESTTWDAAEGGKLAGPQRSCGRGKPGS
ncbi:hypothetical protein E2320_002015 [Naja naja]|nr:hypothetical protein E2320_002015 [Naja naja]